MKNKALVQSAWAAILEQRFLCVKNAAMLIASAVMAGVILLITIQSQVIDLRRTR